MININNVNPNLKKFIFDSQTMVLKNDFHGYRYCCYNKYCNQILYQYFTMVPNSSYGNKPVDFLTSFDGKDKKAYILVGNLLEKISYNEFELLCNEVRKLDGIECRIGISSEQLDVILKYYKTRFFNEQTIEDMLKLHENFNKDLSNLSLTQFSYYYDYYQDIEKVRLDYLESILLFDKTQKNHQKKIDF